MSARIVVQTGLTAGSEHWIDKPVVRIGSAPSNDMVIPSSSLDPHVLTIEYRSSGYRVYNRGQQQVFVGGGLIETNQFSAWPDSDLLELPDGIALALEIDGDPSPSSQPNSAFQSVASADPTTVKAFQTQEDWIGADSDMQVNSPITDSNSPTEATTAVRTTQTKSRKTALQLAVTAVCLIGCGLLLVRHQLKQDSDSDAPKPQFEIVLREAREPSSRVPAQLIDELQLAEAAFVRDQPTTARTAYRRLHDAVVSVQAETLSDSSDLGLQQQGGPQPGSPPSPSDTVDPQPDPLDQVRMLVEYRLRQLANN